MARAFDTENELSRAADQIITIIISPHGNKGFKENAFVLLPGFIDSPPIVKNVSSKKLFSRRKWLKLSTAHKRG